MSRSHMIAIIKEALEVHKDNPAQAHRQVLQKAKDDPKLLLQITDPHLNGIVAYAIDWVSRYGAGTEAQDMSTEELDHIGAALAASIAEGGGDKFGTQGTGLAGRPGKASDDHIAAIHKIAGTANKDE